MLFLSYLGAIAFGLFTSNAAGAIGSAAFGSFGFGAFSLGVSAYQYFIG